MDAPTCAPNGRILVVDDNARALRAMSELLQFEGFSVLTAKRPGRSQQDEGRRSRFPGSARSLDASDGRMEVCAEGRSGSSECACGRDLRYTVDLDGVESILTKPIDLNQ